MTQKHDYLSALSYIEVYGLNTICEGRATDAVQETVINALRIADKLTQEPSEEMLDGKARDALLEYSCYRHITKAKAIDNIFKAMRDQMLKEIE